MKRGCTFRQVLWLYYLLLIIRLHKKSSINMTFNSMQRNTRMSASPDLTLSSRCSFSRTTIWNWLTLNLVVCMKIHAFFFCQQEKNRCLVKKSCSGTSKQTRRLARSSHLQNKNTVFFHPNPSLPLLCPNHIILHLQATHWNTTYIT